MLINFLLFLTHTLLKTDLFINIILGVNEIFILILLIVLLGKDYLSIKAVFCGTTYQKNSNSLKTQLHLRNYLENILLNVLINLLWTCT